MSKAVSMVMASLVVSALTLSACTRADNQTGADAGLGTTEGTAAVRGTDATNMDLTEQIRQCQSMMQQQGATTQQAGTANNQGYDQCFVEMMTQHHQGAIRMAEDAQQNATSTEIRQMAQRIATEHRQEVAQMQDLRNRWANQMRQTTGTPSLNQTTGTSNRINDPATPATDVMDQRQ